MNSQLQSGGSGVIYSPSTRYWDIARKSGSGTQADDRLNFYNSVGGNILTLTGDDKVGINDSSPERSLDVNGTARVTGYIETGESSIPYKKKLIAFSRSLPCTGGTTFDFSLGVNENRVISTNVLVQTGSSSF